MKWPLLEYEIRVHRVLALSVLCDHVVLYFDL